MDRKQSINVKIPNLAILNTAERLFAERGYAATTMRQIASEAKVNGSMVSYYFGSKEALYNMIFTLRLQELKKVFDEEQYANHSKATKLEAFLSTYILHIETYKDFHKLLLREYSLLSSPKSDNSMIREHILNNLASLRQLVIEQASMGFVQKIDITLFCVNVVAFTPRLLLENSRSTYSLVDALEDSDNGLPISERIKNFYYSQLFGEARYPNQDY